MNLSISIIAIENFSSILLYFSSISLSLSKIYLLLYTFLFFFLLDFLGFHFDNITDYNLNIAQKYLLRKGSPRGTNYGPSAQLTEVDKTLKIKIIAWFKELQSGNSDENGQSLISQIFQLINDNQEIPIVKIENYKKFLYNLEKQNKEKKKNTKKTELKEIQLSTGIADNDLNTKSRKAREFLTNGNKVKCTLMLKGREKYVPERGQIIMLKFADSLVDIAIPDNMPKLENNHWMMILHQIPKK